MSSARDMPTTSLIVQRNTSSPTVTDMTLLEMYRVTPPSSIAPRVLLVDDCPVQLLLSCVLLARWHILPELASDGLAAVLLASEQEFDLVLMDVDMPMMDGLTATRRIRKHEMTSHRARRVPVVAHTGNEGALAERAWRDSGVDAVMGKPTSGAVMGQCLQRWCPHFSVPSQASPATDRR
jgi:CheY-like chemotaxis protein